LDDDTLKKMLQVLNEMNTKLDRLDDLINVMKMGQKISIEATKAELLSKSKLRRDVYKLCDGKHNVSEIALSLGKSISLISQSISKMQEAGLIAEERVGKTRYYERVI
jgi:DNA-binding transcriptional ArsR family regulator